MTIFDDPSGEIPLNAVDAHVGARLRARRMLVQMSEEWLAGQLCISVEDLQEMEQGQLRISYDHLIQLIDLLDVTERYFYQGVGSTPPERPRASNWIREVDKWFRSNLFPHEAALMAVARKLTGNNETARELVQETYAVLLTGERWRGILNPRAYAMQAIRGISLKFIKRARVVPIDLVANMESVDQSDLGPSAYDVVSVKQRTQLILDAIEQLPPQCRKVVKMRRMKEMLPRQIAEELGISVSMVEKHLARGMVLIADVLGRHDRGGGAEVARDRAKAERE
ncbi:sigma-70 family RNA polymerase sigma factor [Asticcacaulis benevestitus]|uniref:HTH cro/C1-type domain-containing protein n=1 Tax=Asticcacaulis benevestitus DSM 16100 = ATCC BAA-896 TaxID=1121022 RepID=V4PF57_9CAUL|nr:sigma-70 family RNA polymerase sigma factor [Asticcacaulis benevestitus]ESQ92582.1 hypothetical protein ABENE_08060 [Asticcacaulis benevestitus DSM 16100 = ATCC BAA-896]